MRSGRTVPQCIVNKLFFSLGALCLLFVPDFSLGQVTPPPVVVERPRSPLVVAAEASRKPGKKAKKVITSASVKRSTGSLIQKTRPLPPIAAPVAPATAPVASTVGPAPVRADKQALRKKIAQLEADLRLLGSESDETTPNHEDDDSVVRRSVEVQKELAAARALLEKP